MLHNSHVLAFYRRRFHIAQRAFLKYDDRRHYNQLLLRKLEFYREMFPFKESF